LSFPGFSGRRRRPLLLLSAVMAGLAAPAFAESTALPDLSAMGFAVDGGQPVRLHVAQSREAAQLQVQIQQLEEQVRLLTGQVEGLQFQLTQMQALLERMTEDYEYRFEALEGGAVGKPPAATESGGDMPAVELPQTPQTMEEDDDDRDELDNGMPMHGEFGDPMHEDDRGESQDPLIGAGSSGAGGVLGTLSDSDGFAHDGRPLNLSIDGRSPLANGDAAAQYEAGYDAIERGDYAFAEDQFQQFVALYPDDPQAPDATNWLGEALIQRGAYDDAALVLAEGYQRYQDTNRAPDLMLKLGIALFGAGEQEVACRTYLTLETRYANLSAPFMQRLAAEKSRAQCAG
jgi:tol-pal system protein YbgF